MWLESLCNVYILVKLKQEVIFGIQPVIAQYLSLTVINFCYFGSGPASLRVFFQCFVVVFFKIFSPPFGCTIVLLVAPLEDKLHDVVRDFREISQYHNYAYF